MPKITAKFTVGLKRGMLLERKCAMFGFTPPPAPETPPTPCPECAGHEAIALYATARTEYFRCVHCHHVWQITHDDQHPAAPVAA